MEQAIKLLVRARAYESYIVPKIRGREAFYPDELDALRLKAQ